MHISRRTFLAAAGAALVAPPRAHAQRRPNILFIFTDDQALWAMGCSGNGDAHTPNMDRIAAEGVYLSNAFVTTPVCSPSRVGLLTGRFGSEAGITDWIHPKHEPELGLKPGTPTWVAALRDAGYRTGLIGKWHLGTQDRYHPSVFGYDYFMGFREGGNKVENPMLEVDGVEQEVSGLTMDILTDDAVKFIETSEGPWMLSVHYRAPHSPWKPVKPEDAAPYDDEAITLPDPEVDDLDVDRVDRVMREYLASTSGVDRNVGRILESLDTTGLAEDTVVIFTSDHGYNVGHHGILHKGNGWWITKSGLKLKDPERRRPNMWDHSMRVPALVRWPGRIEAGSRVEQCITNIDWYATLLAMADVSAEPHRYSRNFLPLLEGRSIPWDDTFYGEYGMHHYSDVDMRVVRTPDWKLVRDLKNEDRHELYDLVNDPGERMNQINNPMFAGRIAELDKELERRMSVLRPI